MKTTKCGDPRISKKVFDATLLGFMDRIDGRRPGRVRYATNRRFTLRVLRTLGSQDIADYVRSFLNVRLAWAHPDPDTEEKDV